MASPSQPKSLIFDLEVAPGKADQPDRIFMVGALRPDTGEELERKVDKDLPSVLDALDSLGQGASFVLGHNVSDHDLPMLKRQPPVDPPTASVERFGGAHPTNVTCTAESTRRFDYIRGVAGAC